MKRLAVALVLALLPMVALAPTVGAASDWCYDGDPIVVIKTPKGNLVPLYNTNGVYGLSNVPALALAKVTYTAQPADGGRKTLVKMEVTLPDGLYGSGFKTRATMSTGPMGTLDVLDTGEGLSGEPIKLQFMLDVP